VLVPAGCVVEAVTAEVMVTVGDNDRVDEGTPTDGTHEIAVVRRHIVECAQVDLSFFHLASHIDTRSEVG
jgi:hypothetical protein